MIKEETRLTTEDIRLLKSLGRVKGRRLRMLVLLTFVALDLGIVLLASSRMSDTGISIPVAIAFLLLTALCFFMWRGMWLMSRRSQRGIQDGRKGIVELQLKTLKPNGKGGLDYGAANGEVYRVAVPLPGISILGKQQADFYPGVIEQAEGLPGEKVLLHISATGVLLQVSYPNQPAVKAAAALTETDKQLVWEHRGKEKIIVIGRVTEILHPIKRGKRAQDTYIRLGDTLYLLKPLRPLEQAISTGQEVHLHFLPGKHGEADQLLYLLGS
ncbi:hypothetical protein [Chitinophaga flava]|uniref:Uncharacterized protein n=1 Tax=Chitinophaga flava TaxID=2259036 RepID=A0A365XV91_9BACT|nr:hypothetical protein [Chitinophaga flava]RBL90018.1 hypothetical protein DF182_26455 [Chitinophaga flava]